MADAVVRQAMQKSPDERYQSAGRMRDDLERALAGRAITAPMGAAAGAGDDQLTTRMGSPPTSSGTRVMPRGGSSYQDPYADRTARYDESSYDDPYGGYDQYSDQTERYGGGRGDRYDATDEAGRFDDDDRDGRRGRGNAWKFVLAGLGVILVFVVVTLLATSLFGGPGGDDAKNKATIPNGLVGKPVGVAQAQLERLGFTDIRRQNEQRQDKPKDTVLAVAPAMGTEVAKTTPITLTVATEPGQVTVPEVVGQTEAIATQRLTGAGFTVETAQFTGPTTRNPGTVESTDPVGNTSADRGSLVTISIVSAQAQIPTVTGQPAAAARSALQSYGFQVVEKQTANTAPAGTVVGLSPAAGSTVARRSQVVIFVSMGQPTQPPATPPATTPVPTETGPPPTQPTDILPPDTNPQPQPPEEHG
jgi:serine/threonine-protein kinase